MKYTDYDQNPQLQAQAFRAGRSAAEHGFPGDSVWNQYSGGRWPELHKKWEEGHRSFTEEKDGDNA